MSGIGATSYKPGTTQNVAYTGTHGVITNPVGRTQIRVYCTTDAFIVIGAAPVATAAAGMPVTGKIPEVYDCEQGDKVSAIQQSAGGTLYVTALAKS